MKTATRLVLLIFSISLISSCAKEDDAPAGTTPTLATFLKGNFNVTQTDYSGSLSSLLGSIPVSGTGTNTDGFFLFESFTKTTTYLLNTNMEVATVSYPLYVGGAGTFEILSETSFNINDALSGTTTYEVSERTTNSLIISTGYDGDTLGGSANLVLNIYLTKD
jgi:hypothetical protein